MFQVGLSKTVERVKKEEFKFPVLTTVVRDLTKKGSASKMKFNSAAYVALNLVDHSKILLGRTEVVDEMSRIYICDGRMMNEAAAKFLRNLTKGDMSFSNKDDYQAILKDMSLYSENDEGDIVYDDQVDHNFKIVDIESVEIGGTAVLVGYLELMDVESDNDEVIESTEGIVEGIDEDMTVDKSESEDVVMTENVTTESI